MPDLSDTVAKCRMGTAKKFYTSIASLSHTSKRGGRITLTADSHSLETIVFGYRQALEILQACGFSSLWYLSPEGFRERPLPQL